MHTAHCKKRSVPEAGKWRIKSIGLADLPVEREGPVLVAREDPRELVRLIEFEHDDLIAGGRVEGARIGDRQAIREPLEDRHAGGRFEARRLSRWIAERWRERWRDLDLVDAERLLGGAAHF